MLWQPGHELVHLWQVVGLAGLILLGPAVDLTGQVPTDPPKPFEPYRPVIHLMKRGQHVDHRLVGRAPLRRLHLRQGMGAQHTPLDEVHNIERGANDGRVLTQDPRSRHGHIRGPQRRDDAEFSVYRVR